VALPFSIVDFATSVDISRCKIQNTPDLLFLCGGPTAADGIGPYASARDFFHRYLINRKPALANRVRLAEVLDEWFRRDRDKAFPDLLELEKYLAHLASLTVLFVESAGSIAELGAFAATDALCPKTVAIMNEPIAQRPSFIKDGPVRRLENVNPAQVLFYPWNLDDVKCAENVEVFEEVSNDLVDMIEAKDRERPKQVAFDRGDTGHTLLLVADLLRLAGVAQDTAIAECLRVLDCVKAGSELVRHFSILQGVGFVAKRRRQTSTFYESHAIGTPFISYAFKDGDDIETDPLRVQVLLRDSLGKRETRILQDSLRKAGQRV
jgi:hypothetical protein